METNQKSLKIDFPIYVDYTFDGKFYNVEVKFGKETLNFSTRFEEKIEEIALSMCNTLIKSYND